MMETIIRKEKEFGMKITLRKTKVMTIGKNEGIVNTFSEGKTIEQMNLLKYLESKVTWNRSCREEITSVLSKAKQY